jgi:hypothetical protein
VLYADKQSIGAAIATDYGGDDSAKRGLYAAIVVAERGATFSNPVTGAAVRTGAAVDVHVPGQPGYRDVTLLLADDDPQIGADFMPYPLDVAGTPLVSYRNGGRRSDSFAGDPSTPLITAYAGDPLRIHVIATPGSEQSHVFYAGGMSWPRDPSLPGAGELAQQAVAPAEAIDVQVVGGAGGRAAQVRDFWYGDLRRPFAEGGMWGLVRVLASPSCGASGPLMRLEGSGCS